MNESLRAHYHSVKTAKQRWLRIFYCDCRYTTLAHYRGFNDEEIGVNISILWPCFCYTPIMIIICWIVSSIQIWNNEELFSCFMFGEHNYIWQCGFGSSSQLINLIMWVFSCNIWMASLLSCHVNMMLRSKRCNLSERSAGICFTLRLLTSRTQVSTCNDDGSCQNNFNSFVNLQSDLHITAVLVSIQIYASKVGPDTRRMKTNQDL